MSTKNEMKVKLKQQKILIRRLQGKINKRVAIATGKLGAPKVKKPRNLKRKQSRGKGRGRRDESFDYVPAQKNRE